MLQFVSFRRGLKGVVVQVSGMCRFGGGGEERGWGINNVWCVVDEVNIDYVFDEVGVVKGFLGVDDEVFGEQDGVEDVEVGQVLVFVVVGVYDQYW